MYENQRSIAKSMVNGVCRFGNGAAIGGLFAIGARASSSNPILSAVFQVCAFVSAAFVADKISDDIKPEVDKTVDKIVDIFDPNVQMSTPEFLHVVN